MRHINPDKTQENKGRAAAHRLPNQKSSHTTFHFEDNRPESVAQRKLQGIMNNSPFQPVQKKENKPPGKSTETLQRVFNPATVTANARLCSADQWSTPIGNRIGHGTTILADDSAVNDKTQAGRWWFSSDTTWKGAANIKPKSKTSISAKEQGYIRSQKVNFTGNNTLEKILKARIQQSLQGAEQLNANLLKDHLDKPENVDFLFEKAVRYDAWNKKASLATFVSGFSAKEGKMARIDAGAKYVAHSLAHWRKWLYPQDMGKVSIQAVKLVQSDLHEKGLGVLQVKFKKPKGPKGHKFATETDVEVMIKPEDKSLEESLLGDNKKSAANQINTIVGLTDPKEMLTTIRMQSDKNYGTLVEKVKGLSAEDLTAEGKDKPVNQAFHETLVFAFLAGLDDLHKENVFWDNGKPYLIDADNVLSHNQMINKDNGALTQSGFGADYDQTEAENNQQAIQDKDATFNSKILKTMIEDRGKAIRIIDVLKGAITGKTGRVVPIRTSAWAKYLKLYMRAGDAKDALLGDFSSIGFIVRETSGFDAGIGPGLMGTSFKNADNPFYAAAVEKAQLKADFEAGVIPFYEYDFTSGYVTHNGVKIYHGQTLKQAMERMLNYFGHVR